MATRTSAQAALLQFARLFGETVSAGQLENMGNIAESSPRSNSWADSDKFVRAELLRHFPTADQQEFLNRFGRAPECRERNCVFNGPNRCMREVLGYGKVFKTGPDCPYHIPKDGMPLEGGETID